MSACPAEVFALCCLALARSIARPWDADMCQRLTALYQTIRRPDYRALEINLQTNSSKPMSRFVVDAKTMTLKNMTTGEGGCMNTDKSTAAAARAALQYFFKEKFPGFAKNPFFITGESCAATISTLTYV